MSDDDKKVGMCYRCEYRAQYLERGHAPRCECGDVEISKYGCYMYKPVRPVVLAPDANDPRPALGPPMISSRVYSVSVAEGEYHRKEIDGKLIPYFVPEDTI